MHYSVSTDDLLKSRFDDMIHSLPSDYEKTLQVVQDHLTDDQICEVLTSPNHTVANTAIMNCLIEKVKCTGDIVELCNQLDKITLLLPKPGVLLSVAAELRKG